MRDHQTELDVEGGTRHAVPGKAPEWTDGARAAAAGRFDALSPAAAIGLQRAAGNASVARALDEDETVLDVVGSGGGQALDRDTRSDMEARFGHDFGDVRVHTGQTADRSAAAVQATAYTVGSDIVFRQGAYDPGTAPGRHVLAHELTHVVQQRSGPVDGTDTGSGIRVSDPGDRFEREAAATADHVMQRQDEDEELEEEALG